MKAFPGMDIRAQYEGSWDDKFLVPFTGMDLRDYFAAKAMQAIIGKADDRSTTIEEVVLWVGHYAYKVADAMIEERK
jgi:hypothetical protein